MKLNKTIILVLFLVLFQAVKGQKTGISSGRNYQGFSTGFKKYFTLDDVMLVVNFYRENIILQTFSLDSLTLIKSKNFQGFPKNVQVEDVLKFNNRIYLFYSSLIDNDTIIEEKLYMKEINVDSCSFEKTKLLMTVKGNVTAILSKHDFVDNFDFSSTLDQDRFVVQYKKKKKELIANVAIGYKVFDRDFNLVSEKEIEMPYSGLQIENVDFAIDSQHNIYLASYVYRNKKSRKNGDKYGPMFKITASGAINYDIEIFKIGTTTGIYSKSKIELDSGYHINSFKFFPISNEQLIVAGYSSVVGRLSKFNEPSWIFKFNILDSIRKIDTLSIPTEIVHQNLKQSEVNFNNSMLRRYGSKWKPSIKKLIPEYLILDKDGGMILIGEQQTPIFRNYVIPLPIPGGAVFTSTISEHMLYNDVLISKFNADGTNAWIKKLAKRQETTNRVDFLGLRRRGLSFKLHEGDGEIYIFFVDQLKNLTLPSNKTPAELNDDGNHGYLMAHKINTTSGKINKAALFDVEKIQNKQTNKFNIFNSTSFGKYEVVFEVFTKPMTKGTETGSLTRVNLK